MSKANIMKSKELVEYLYETLLERPADPGGLRFYASRLEATGDVRDIITSLVKSEEFLKLRKQSDTPIATDIFRFGEAPALSVEVDVADAECDRLLQATARTWQNLGASEPHWSVLTAEEFRQEQLDENEFYVTGATDLTLLKAFFKRAGCDLASVKSVLEIGCGVGRFTEHVSKIVSSVEAIDVSAAHLAIAKKRIAHQNILNVDFRQITAVADLDNSLECELLYTVIVLQHNPPPVMKIVLEKALQRVARGGFAYFQLPTYRKGYSFNLKDYVPSPEQMEMHILPQSIVFSTLHNLNFKILEVQEDTWVGNPTEYQSNTFFARRL